MLDKSNYSMFGVAARSQPSHTTSLKKLGACWRMKRRKASQAGDAQAEGGDTIPCLPREKIHGCNKTDISLQL